MKKIIMIIKAKKKESIVRIRKKKKEKYLISFKWKKIILNYLSCISYDLYIDLFTVYKCSYITLYRVVLSIELCMKKWTVQ